MKLSYSTTIRDELLNIDVVTDLECDLIVSAERDCGSFAFTIDAIYVDGKNLFLGAPLTKRLAAQIAGEAEDELNRSGTRIRDRAMDQVLVG